MHAMAADGAAPAWPAPAVDPRMLMAIVLIFVELMLVTAMALFFSTFSSPLLSALLTLGLWVVGHFSADLRNFGEVVDSAGRGWLARVVYYVLPNLAPFDVKAQVVHGMPMSRRGTSRYTLAYARVYIARPADGGGHDLLARGISSDADDAPRSTTVDAIAAVRRRIALLLAARRSACRSCAIAAGRRISRRTACCGCTSGDRSRERLALGFDTSPPTSTGSARVSTTAAAQRLARRRRTQRNFDLLYPLLDLSTSLDPLFNVAYRFGAIFLAEPHPGGPGRPDLAIALLEERHRARRRGSTCRTSASCITGGGTTTRRPPSGSSEPASIPGAPCGCGRWRRRRWREGGDRESSRQLWTQLLQ